MKRSVLAATVLIGVSALSGSAGLTGSATAAPEMHTKKLVLHNKAEQFRRQADVRGVRHCSVKVEWRNRRHDSFAGKYYPREDRVVIQVAFALKGGIIVGRVSGHPSGEGPFGFDGRILKGSGKYLGIDGEIEAHSAQGNPEKLFLTMHYHF